MHKFLLTYVKAGTSHSAVVRANKLGHAVVHFEKNYPDSVLIAAVYFDYEPGDPTEQRKKAKNRSAKKCQSSKKKSKSCKGCGFEISRSDTYCGECLCEIDEL